MHRRLAQMSRRLSRPPHAPLWLFSALKFSSACGMTTARLDARPSPWGSVGLDSEPHEAHAEELLVQQHHRIPGRIPRDARDAERPVLWQGRRLAAMGRPEEHCGDAGAYSQRLARRMPCDASDRISLQHHAVQAQRRAVPDEDGPGHSVVPSGQEAPARRPLGDAHPHAQRQLLRGIDELVAPPQVHLAAIHCIRLTLLCRRVCDHAPRRGARHLDVGDSVGCGCGAQRLVMLQLPHSRPGAVMQHAGALVKAADDQEVGGGAPREPFRP
eukprot:scaffold27712_cov110-Isochrysis_galbana.AAC.1